MYCSSPVSLAKVSTLSCVVSTQSLTPSTVPARSRSPARPSRTSGCRVSPGAASTLIDLILRQSLYVNALRLRCRESNTRGGRVASAKGALPIQRKRFLNAHWRPTSAHEVQVLRRGSSGRGAHRLDHHPP